MLVLQYALEGYGNKYEIVKLRGFDTERFILTVITKLDITFILS